MVPGWFLPALSRDDAEYKLSHQNPGNFLIRQSSHSGSLALSVNTGKSGENGVQHFIINSRDGCVALEDSDLEFDSLVSLVSYYTSNREELPVALKLYTAERKLSAPAGIRRGDSPYVSMVGKQRTKSTIWINSPAFRTSDDESSTLEKDLEVIKSVLEQNSSLDLPNFQNIKSDEKQESYEGYSVRISSKKEPELKDSWRTKPGPEDTWKETSKSWLNSSKYWLDSGNNTSGSGQSDEVPVSRLTTGYSITNNNNNNDNNRTTINTQETGGVRTSWQERLEQDKGSSTVLEEGDDIEYEDYSLPIDIQNSNIYEDPDIVKSNMVQGRPSTKIIYEAFNPIPTFPTITEQPTCLSINPQTSCMYTKENASNKISLPVSSATNVSAPVTTVVTHLPTIVTTPPPATVRQPLEPFQPLRKLSYNQNMNRHERLVRPGSDSSSSSNNNNMLTRSAEYRPKFRKNNSVISPPPFRSLDNKLASSNLSKSCSDLAKEMEKKSGCVQPNELRKSFVRKVSLNLSVRKSNSKPIRKISDAMKKMFPKSLKSLANSQMNSDSWEYLAECGVNPVYEEVQEFTASEENSKSSLINKSSTRCMSCDSLYQSDSSNSNASSMNRPLPDIPSVDKVSGCEWPEVSSGTTHSAPGRNCTESADVKIKSSSSFESADAKIKSSSSGEKRSRATTKPQQPQNSQRAKSKNVGTRAEKILFV